MAEMAQVEKQKRPNYLLMAGMAAIAFLVSTEILENKEAFASWFHKAF